MIVYNPEILKPKSQANLQFILRYPNLFLELPDAYYLILIVEYTLLQRAKSYVQPRIGLKGFQLYLLLANLVF